jgi:hypothetical protein
MMKSRNPLNAFPATGVLLHVMVNEAMLLVHMTDNHNPMPRLHILEMETTLSTH